MIIYKHHMGDFNHATRHLTRLEKSIYRDLIELYYDREDPLPLDIEQLCRLVVANTEQESTAVQQVLNEFFTETPGGWFHARCEEEIFAYQSNTSAKAAAGKASAAAREARKAEKLAKLQQKGNTRSTDVQQPFNSVGTEVQQNPTNLNLNPNLNINTESNNTAQAPAAGKPASKQRKTSLPDDFALTDDRLNAAARHWQTKNRTDLNPHDEFENFLNHHQAHGKAMADWDAAWRTWFTNAVKFSKPTGGTNGHKKSAAERVHEHAMRIIEQERDSGTVVDDGPVVWPSVG